MNVLISIAGRHLLARKRQSIVSLLGIILGVGFFLAIASLMRGSEADFLKRLVDNSPHITVSDSFRNPRLQPLQMLMPTGAVQLKNVKPVPETRGIRGYQQTVEYLQSMPGVRASPMQVGQALISYAGKDYGITLNGVIPDDIRRVTTIEQYLIEGSVDAIISNPDGILIGSELARKLSIGIGRVLAVAATTGTIRNFKVVGIFRTGRSSYDESQSFVHLARVQSLLNRSRRVNSIIVKIPNPQQALQVAADVERRFSYKSVSWQESSEDLMNTFRIRNMITYTIVSAVLIVAAFGIYNVISTVVMEKQREIAILKSMGFFAADIRKIFIVQGAILGMAGSAAGIPLGVALMIGLMQIKIKPPGSSQMIAMPVDWSWEQFAIALAFAMSASILAGYLPARRAARVQPVDILRGGG